jgi:hypothetical protein
VTSPFAEFANATLTFKVPAKAINYDGNFNFDGSNTSASLSTNQLGNPEGRVIPLVVTAMLRKSNRQPTNILNPGSDIDLVLLTGRCINPIALPPEIVVQSVAEAVIDGVAGEFVLGANIQSPFLLKEILGQAIEGYFRVRKIWGDSYEL